MSQLFWIFPGVIGNMSAGISIVDDHPGLGKSPIYLFACLLAAHQSKALSLEQMFRCQLSKLGVQVVFTDPSYPSYLPVLDPHTKTDDLLDPLELLHFQPHLP